MTHLPQYWAVKIEKEHSLWNEFVNELMISYIGVRDGIFEEWQYVLKDADNTKLNFSRKPYSSFKSKGLELITIEEFLQHSWEIY